MLTYFGAKLEGQLRFDVDDKPIWGLSALCSREALAALKKHTARKRVSGEWVVSRHSKVHMLRLSWHDAIRLFGLARCRKTYPLPDGYVKRVQVGSGEEDHKVLRIFWMERRSMVQLSGRIFGNELLV